MESKGYYKEFIDTTISSPPYYDTKSYGYENQIGYGQKYSEYLGDLESVFKCVFETTNSTGSLWIVCDSIRRNNKVVLLPFDLSNCLKNVGWNLADVIIWEKDKNLPWSGKGRLRNIFEYILFFTKSEDYKYYSDRIKLHDLSQLKEWWVQYPERYNPFGVALTNVWNLPIPTQGSWSGRSLKHFNPFSKRLVERILLLTTNEGDVVFDPFAGSGTVLAVADFMKRRWLGFEKNPQYCKMFYEHILNETKEEMSSEMRRNNDVLALKTEFENTIKKLRLVKFPKSLIKQAYRKKILDARRDSVNSIFAVSKEPSKDDLNRIPKHKFLVENIFLIFENKPRSGTLETQIEEIASKPPLSKFGIDHTISLVEKDDFVPKYRNSFDKLSWVLYAYGIVHKFEKETSFAQWLHESAKPQWRDLFKSNIPPIISNVEVSRKIRKTWKSREDKHKILKDMFEEMVQTN